MTPEQLAALEARVRRLEEVVAALYERRGANASGHGAAVATWRDRKRPVGEP